MGERLSKYEQDTIISSNRSEDLASVFTYEKRWQKHIEGKPGLEPIMDNGSDGKEYEVPKNMIRLPRAPRSLANPVMKKLADHLRENRRRMQKT